MYADDTSAVVSRPSISETEHQSNNLLQNMTKWFNENKLYLNGDKTKYLIFHTIQNKTEFNLHLFTQNVEIRRVSEVDFLGITIDETCSWHTHCEMIVNKLNAMCYQIRNLKNMIDLQSLLSFYYANVHSRISYGITFWGAESIL